MNENKFMTLQEIAKLLDVTDKTIYRYCGLRKIPFTKVVGRYRFDRMTIKQWLADRTFNPLENNTDG